MSFENVDGRRMPAYTLSSQCRPWSVSDLSLRFFPKTYLSEHYDTCIICLWSYYQPEAYSAADKNILSGVQHSYRNVWNFVIDVKQTYRPIKM